MHEFSIAMSILDCAAEESERRGDAKVVAVHLRLGPLSGVVKEALLWAYEMASEVFEVSQCAGSKLVVEDVPVTAFCPTCGVEREIESIQEICCPACRTPTPDVRGGRELEVTALEIC
jgi:hydrogenase nickel incorporation protein HypA/HybF